MTCGTQTQFQVKAMDNCLLLLPYISGSTSNGHAINGPVSYDTKDKLYRNSAYVTLSHSGHWRPVKGIKGLTHISGDGNLAQLGKNTQFLISETEYLLYTYWRAVTLNLLIVETMEFFMDKFLRRVWLYTVCMYKYCKYIVYSFFRSV
jgi:hypothetical protein